MESLPAGFKEPLRTSGPARRFKKVFRKFIRKVWNALGDQGGGRGLPTIGTRIYDGFHFKTKTEEGCDDLSYRGKVQIQVTHHQGEHNCLGEQRGLMKIIRFKIDKG